jgi:beta-lactam-binding protein with PASTA domain
VDGPRISLLVSDPQTAAQPSAYVMPSLIGLSYNAASARTATVGLRIVAAADNPSPAASSSEPTPNGSPSAIPAPNNPPASPAAIQQTDIVLAQTPQPGRRVVQGDAVHITLRHSPPSPSANSSQ